MSGNIYSSHDLSQSNVGKVQEGILFHVSPKLTYIEMLLLLNLLLMVCLFWITFIFSNLLQLDSTIHSKALCLQAFAHLLQAPRDEADSIIKERFPVPRLVICDQHGSQVLLNFLTPQMC